MSFKDKRKEGQNNDDNDDDAVQSDDNSHTDPHIRRTFTRSGAVGKKETDINPYELDDGNAFPDYEDGLELTSHASGSGRSVPIDRISGEFREPLSKSTMEGMEKMSSEHRRTLSWDPTVPDRPVKKKSITGKLTVSQSSLIGQSFLDGSYGDVNTNLLASAVNDAGLLSFGTVGVGVWILNESMTKLIPPNGGFWVNPLFEFTNPSVAMSRLTDSEREDYMPRTPLAPGEGIAGVMWYEMNTFGNKRHSILWRDVRSIVKDPFYPYHPRLNLLLEAGFELAAGVPFNVRGHKGIVLYLARDMADRHKLLTKKNEEYLISAADLIGAISAMRTHGQNALNDRIIANPESCSIVKGQDSNQLVRQIDLNIEENEKKSKDMFGHINTSMKNQNSSISECDTRNRKWVEAKLTQIKIHFTMWVKKLQGGHMTPPPKRTWNHTILTVIGCFINLLTIVNCDVLIKHVSNGKRYLDVPPLASLTLLQYGLTAAPPSQPRSILAGTMCSVLPGLFLNRIPSFSPLWRDVVAATIACCIMTKFNIIHPPSVAFSIIFKKNRDFVDLGLLLSVQFTCVLLATAINNTSSNRQYPAFWWGFATIGRVLNGLVSKCYKKDKLEDEPDDNIHAQ